MPNTSLTETASLSGSGLTSSHFFNLDWGQLTIPDYKALAEAIREAKAQKEPADWMIGRLEKAVQELRAELEGVRELRRWEEERLQERERESWTTC